MDDHKDQMTDAELQKLLQQIDVPAPDDHEITTALNMAESRFAENVKKNEKTRQGNAGGSRLMDVLHATFITLTGGKNMKTSYAIAGALAIGVASIALLSNQDMLMRGTGLKTTFNRVGQGLRKGPIVHEEHIAQQRTVSPPPPAAVQLPSPPPVPAPPPAPRIQYNAPQMKATAKREMESRVTAGISADMAVRMNAIPAPGIVVGEPYPLPQVEQNRDKFEKVSDNPVKSVQSQPVSTFSIDVDTASYAVVRRALNNGQLPPRDAVRVEELVNYFDYDYPVPESREAPFQPTVALYETPWNPDTVLMHVGIKGYELPADTKKPHSNLVFLLDVSGSMNQQDKLPLLKQAFHMLVDSLQPDDTISIVTYAGYAGVALEPTRVSEKGKIFAALDNLQAGGSTAGAQGIRTAYDLAQQGFDKDGVNRVILATDGDFNVGMTDNEQLKSFIEQKRETGIYLSILGFGMGNYNDALMQTLAQNGNGNAAYIDSINEARKVLVDEATSTLYPIANDVKIQVEFNPAKVAEYRLIGYETRHLNREDFNNDKVDAGDIGAGHTVTALYELTPVGSKAKLMDDLRYGQQQEAARAVAAKASDEYAFLKLRYKLPGEKTSKLINRPVTQSDLRPLDGLSNDIRFAGAVAAFGQMLRGEQYMGSFTYDNVLELATNARGDDPFNYRGEFLNLVRNAKVAQQGQNNRYDEEVAPPPPPVIMYQR